MHTHIYIHIYVYTAVAKCITRGRNRLLTLRLGSQPLGREILSWYSAGSQRVRGVLEDPKSGFFLGKKNEILYLSFSLSGTTMNSVQHTPIIDLTAKICQRTCQRDGKTQHFSARFNQLVTSLFSFPHLAS